MLRINEPFHLMFVTGGKINTNFSDSIPTVVEKGLVVGMTLETLYHQPDRDGSSSPSSERPKSSQILLYTLCTRLLSQHHHCHHHRNKQKLEREKETVSSARLPAFS
jgi:hypothetical protein